MIQDIFPHRFDNHFVAGKTIEDKDFVLHYKDNTLLLKSDNNGLELPQKKDFTNITDQTEATFLFTLNEVSCFLVWDAPSAKESDITYQEINFFRTASRKEVAWVGVVGYHLRNWYAEHRFCGKCGTKTVHKSDERAMMCPACHTLFFPKISPAIIVAITSGDKILLAHNANFKPGWFSLIAGYADVGETLEETVRREVKEEVGLDVKNIRYYTSQPWPLSGSVMVGFTAEADENQPIVIDQNEIAEAAWYTRGNLPDHPTNVSVGGELIEKFEKGEL
ncbi:NAD(+) diphosphatase [Paludibacter sp.]|uniref:NAD(+) diphosphatase n=1 Tax=Paludibacter sp. TaxID=1898105 RepID=UPI0013532749|nr:NAD(+) diphosphatase [Paludibacter sp.]MTK54285.1 NAD(+) diphosphatase [Paludibacter sp.]